jgi:glycosyltransferase involved in cell wall biosynthesis
MTEPGVRLSVVIPAYNEGSYLDASLTSLRQQDFSGSYEVIVVDNNSTDDTAAIASAHGARVLHEPRRGVCVARERGTRAARGEIVVSTDADAVHPADWLTRLDAQFQRNDGAIAVAGPCRYADPPWWAAIFPRLWFAAVSLCSTTLGRVFYLTATNLAFVRSRFPGYDTTLTQGGDELDLLRRLQARGKIIWDPANPVFTSSRRMNQGLPHTVVVSFGYHYAGSYLVNRLTSRTVLGAAPAIRGHDAEEVGRRRRRWRAGAAMGTVMIAALVQAASGR